MTRPEGQRLCTDPYARSFVSALTFYPTWALVRLGILDVTLPRGTVDFALARERYIHDLMVREISSGIQQLVILGAGFDTRAYRIAELGDIPVFEVDHPVTQAGKRAALEKVDAKLPAKHTFVSVDFDKQQLGDRLAMAGYDQRARTLFVWQCVIMYLTRQGVDGTLAFIADHSGPGSMVVFDYFQSDRLRGAKAASMMLMVRAMGEPVTFGIPAAEIGSFLETRGFTNVENADAAELRRLYMTGPNASRPVVDGAAIASARVARR
jgi:methyltransferase (TIGR00027 family)